jgi:hypothetical protein
MDLPRGEHAVTWGRHSSVPLRVTPRSLLLAHRSSRPSYLLSLLQGLFQLIEHPKFLGPLA